jgi:hypothetical protein
MRNTLGIRDSRRQTFQVLEASTVVRDYFSVCLLFLESCNSVPWREIDSGTGQCYIKAPG